MKRFMVIFAFIAAIMLASCSNAASDSSSAAASSYDYVISDSSPSWIFTDEAFEKIFSQDDALAYNEKTWTWPLAKYALNDNIIAFNEHGMVYYYNQGSSASYFTGYYSDGCGYDTGMNDKGRYMKFDGTDGRSSGSAGEPVYVSFPCVVMIGRYYSDNLMKITKGSSSALKLQFYMSNIWSTPGNLNKSEQLGTFMPLDSAGNIITEIGYTDSDNVKSIPLPIKQFTIEFTEIGHDKVVISSSDFSLLPTGTYTRL